MTRASLEQAVGEAAGGSSRIEAASAGGVDHERVERGGELLTTTRDVTRSGNELDRRGRVDDVSGLAVASGVVAAADDDLAGEQDCLRLRARLGQPPLDKKLVEPDAA